MPLRFSLRFPGLPACLAAVSLAAAATAAHADLAYAFDAGLAGFTLNDPAAGDLRWEAAGHLRVQDVSGDTNVLLVLPTADTAGGWASYLGGTLSFDARLESPIGSYWPEFGTVSLIGAAGTLSLDLVPADQPGTVWQTYSIRLDAETWGRDEAGFAAALAGLQRVEINMEAGNGAIETILVDKVRVSAVPEPSAAWLGLMGGMGALGLSAVWRRRRA